MSVGANIQGGDQLKAILVRLGQPVQAQLRVGVLEGSTNAEGENVANYAAANEFGTKNIPSRPFMRWTVKQYSREWAKGIADGLHHTNFQYVKVLKLAGETVKGQIITSIAGWKTPPNSEETKKRKMKGGDNEGHPLVAEGDMMHSIDYEVK